MFVLHLSLGLIFQNGINEIFFSSLLQMNSNFLTHNKNEYQVLYVPNDDNCMFKSIEYLIGETTDLRQEINETLANDIVVDHNLQKLGMTLQQYKHNIVNGMRGDRIALHCLSQSQKTHIITINPFTMEKTTYPVKIKEVDTHTFENTIHLLVYPYGKTLRVLPLRH